MVSMKDFLGEASKWAGINAEKQEGKWLEEMRGNMAAVSTFIATMTFQIGVNPPGGVVESHGEVDCPKDMHMNNMSMIKEGTHHNACPGQSVMAVAYRNRFSLFILFNNISFFSSLIVCLWLASGVTFEHRFPTWVMATAMCISLTSLSVTYVFGVDMIGPSPKSPHHLNSTIIAWFAVVGVVVFLLVLRFVLLSLVIFHGKKKSNGGNGQTNESGASVNHRAA